MNKKFRHVDMKEYWQNLDLIYTFDTEEYHLIYKPNANAIKNGKSISAFKSGSDDAARLEAINIAKSQGLI